jgi:hypothetical protein
MSFPRFRLNTAALLLLCILCAGRADGQGQPRSAGFGVEVNFLAGKVLKHSEKFRAPVPDLSTGLEVNLVQQTYGRKAWHQRRRYPQVGLGLAWTNYGIDSIYGKCYSFYPNLQFPIIRGKSLEWTLRVGFGIGFVTRRYQRYPDWDTLNNAVSSHLNNFSIISTDLRWRLSDHLDLQAGLNFTHISNAALKQPNLGVNMYGGHIGLRYFPVTSRPERIIRKLAPLRNRWLAQVRMGFAFNESGHADGPMYPVYMPSVYASKRWRSKNKFFAGLDYAYYPRIEAFQKNNEINIGRERANAWKSSVFAGNEFLMGRMGIILQVGVYLKEAALRLDPYYQKIGLNLYLLQQETGVLKELFISGMLKTHKAQAELAEMGIGFGF